MTEIVRPAGHFALRSLEVESYKCVESARVEFGPGLNVLYGPNDLGKSTLGEALRSVLLLPSSSVDRRGFEPWGATAPPRVRLVFAHRGALWRVEKTWAEGTRGTALLERSGDGQVWSKQETGRSVDGELRKMLAWGVREPGGKGGAKGLPKSFITTALLGASSRIEELFGDTLADDTDPAGRERLTEALQSLAEDPLFKRILTTAQGNVELAKDSRGNWRRGRETPLGRIAERIREIAAEHETLLRQAEQGEAVAAVLHEARVRRDALCEQLDQARADLARVQAAWQAHTVWRQIRAATDAARDRLAAIDRDLQRVAALRVDAEGAHATASALIERAELAAGAVVDAEAARESASATLEALARQDGAEAKLEALRRADLTLQRERHALTERRRALDEALTVDGAAAADARHAEVTTGTARRTTQAHAALADTLVEVDAEIDAAMRQLVWLQWREAAVLAERTEQARAQARALADQARQVREASSVRRAALQRAPLPSATTLATLRTLDDGRRRAEDQAAVGFAVTFTLADGSTAQVTVDGDAPVITAATTTQPALRDMVIDVHKWGSLRIEAGSAALRTGLQAARARWEAEGAPILAAAGVASIDALSTASASWHAEIDRCGKDDARADALDREAAAGTVDDATLTAVRDGLARTRAALGTEEPTAPPGLGADARVPEIRSRHAALQLTRSERREALGRLELDRDLALAESERARALATQSAARAEQVRAGLPPAQAADLVTALAECDDELAAKTRALAAVATEIEGVAAEGQQATAGAQAQLDAAAATLVAARAQYQAFELEVRAAREHAAASTARADEAASSLGGITRDDAATALVAAEAAAAGITAPPPDLDAEAASRVAEHIEAIEQQIREVDGKIHKADGNLEQIGGSAARRRADEKQADLVAAKQNEADVQRDYDGWQLLRDTLRTVETEQGAHLGNALGGAVEQRLRRLTAGRYGRLDLDRDLRAQGLRIAGSPRALDVLSAGLKEQLATLVRLAIAEHLDASVILDDHLAQTDPDRVEFFRSLLRELASRVQMVVLTCRPLDYLEAAELPVDTGARDAGDWVRAVDLAQVIRRGTGEGC